MNEEFRQVDVAVIEDHLDGGAIMIGMAHATDERQHLLRRNKHGLQFMPRAVGIHLDLDSLGAAAKRDRYAGVTVARQAEPR